MTNIRLTLEGPYLIVWQRVRIDLWRRRWRVMGHIRMEEI
jgi:hypothetical protein